MRVRLGRLFLALVILAADLAYSRPLPSAWPGWARYLVITVMVIGMIGGVGLLLNALGILTGDSLAAVGTAPPTERRRLTVPVFLGVYGGIMAVVGTLSVVLSRSLGIRIDRIICVSLGVIFLLASTGRPWWLYHAIRTVNWFAAVRSERAMRVLLTGLGVVLILGGVLSRK